jgi:hypothetical protein
MDLSEAQYRMLGQHVGTTKAQPRRPKHTQAGWEVKAVSIFNPTAKALKRRGLMDYRGHDGISPGGWFISKAGNAAIIS